jgi:hypothetical protein
MAQKHENAQAELVTQAYQNACQGLRLGVVSIKDFGLSMLQAQKVLKMEDNRLYAWVRATTGCQKSDATLNNWKRLAKSWTEKVEAKFKTAENAGKVFTLQDALALIKGKARPGRQKTVETPGDPHVSTNRPLEGTTKATAQAAQEATAEKPIKVQPPFDQPEKDRLAAVYSQNGPASTPIQLMTNIVIPNLKRVAEAGISDQEVPFLANAIKEAMVLIDSLKQKYAIV